MWLPEISLYHSVMGHPREEEDSTSKKKNAAKDNLVDDDDSDTDSIGMSQKLVLMGMHIGLKWYEIDAYNSWTKICFPWALEWVSERMNAVERLIDASSAEQAFEWAVRANEQTEERMALYSTRQFHSDSAHFGMGLREGVEFAACCMECVS